LSAKTTTPNELDSISIALWKFFPSPFGFYPPFIAASPFENPRTTMLTDSEFNDEVDFDAVFSNYGNQSPLRI